MATVAFRKQDMSMCMCMDMDMCSVALLSDQISVQGKRQCTV